MKLKEWKKLNGLHTDKDVENYFRNNIVTGKGPVAIHSCPDCNEILWDEGVGKHTCIKEGEKKKTYQVVISEEELQDFENYKKALQNKKYILEERCFYNGSTASCGTAHTTSTKLYNVTDKLKEFSDLLKERDKTIHILNEEKETLERKISDMKPQLSFKEKLIKRLKSFNLM